MKSLRVRKFSMTMNSIFVACLAFAVHGATNVFDDAVFWFRGGKDCVTSDNYLQQGEFFDDLHANDTDHANHNMSMSSSYYTGDLYSGFLPNAMFRNERVVFPALGTGVVKDMQVLHLSNVAVNYKSKQYYCPFSVNPRSVFASHNISQEYTIVSRIRLDDLDNTECLFRIGYNDTAKQGMTLGLAKHPNHAGCKYITGFCTPSNGVNNASYQFDMRIPTNTWVDVAAVVGNGKLRVGVAMPISNGKNYPSIAFAETPMWTANCQLLGDDYYCLFCFKTITQAAQTVQNYFIGSVQQLAIWDRALSDQDVMDAFGMPRPALFRTGFDNGSLNEFGGSRSGATQEIDGLGSWQNIANTMEAGDTWTVNFTALRDEAGLPQIFSIKSLPDSVAAQIEPTISNASHNVSLGTRRVAANGRTFWPMPADLITEGANTLIIKRKDNGAGVFKMDAMELGGSLGVGTEVASVTDGRVAPDRNPTGIPSAADPNLQHWPQGLQPYKNVTNLHFRVWVDPDVVNVITSRFWTITKCENEDAEHVIQGNETFSLLVNGTTYDTRDSENEWKPLERGFAPGTLLPGWNDIELKSDNTTCRWLVGYYRFETVLPKGFSIPPPGMSIVIR